MSPFSTESWSEAPLGEVLRESLVVFCPLGKWHPYGLLGTRRSAL